MNNGRTKYPRDLGEAARWHQAFTRTERELRALVRRFPALRILDRCDFSCPGVAIFNGSEIQRCDECKRFPSDDEALEFVQLTLQAQALAATTITKKESPMNNDSTKHPCELCLRREELGNCGDCRAGVIMQNGYVMACQHCRLFETDDDALSAAWALLQVLQDVYAEGPGHPAATVADALDDLKGRV